jgi:hypothetical protein
VTGVTLVRVIAPPYPAGETTRSNAEPVVATGPTEAVTTI